MLKIVTHEGAMMVLRIFEQAFGRNEMLDVGPTYKLKYKDFFDRSINKGVELGRVPDSSIIKIQANEFLEIVDADPHYRDGNNNLVEQRLNPIGLEMSFASIGYEIMDKILPPLPLNIKIDHQPDAIDANSIVLSKYQEIYRSEFITFATIKDKMVTSVTKLIRQKSFLKNGFSDETGRFYSFKKITTEQNREKLYFQTRKDAELACFRQKTVHNSSASYRKIWEKVWGEYNDKLIHRKAILALNHYFVSDIKKLKGSPEEQVLEVIEKNISSYKDFLEYVSKFNLATELQHRFYLEEGVSINNFFSQEAETQLSLKVIHKYLLKVLT